MKVSIHMNFEKEIENCIQIKNIEKMREETERYKYEVLYYISDQEEWFFPNMLCYL